MALAVVTPATDSVVSLSDAKAYLRVDHDDDDAVITAMIAAVVSWVDGWLGRSLAPVTLELRLPGFPPYCYGGIALPKPPLIAVESVRYLDTDGVEQTLDPSTYMTYVDGAGLPRVSPAAGESWPATADHPEAVKVRYQAGYVDGASPPAVAVPEGLKQAVMMTVAQMYDQRESGLTVNEAMARRLFGPYKVYC